MVQHFQFTHVHFGDNPPVITGIEVRVCPQSCTQLSWLFVDLFREVCLNGNSTLCKFCRFRCVWLARRVCARCAQVVEATECVTKLDISFQWISNADMWLNLCIGSQAFNGNVGVQVYDMHMGGVLRVLIEMAIKADKDQPKARVSLAWVDDPYPLDFKLNIGMLAVMKIPMVSAPDTRIFSSPLLFFRRNEKHLGKYFAAKLRKRSLGFSSM